MNFGSGRQHLTLEGRKFYDEHQAELNRLVLIDAELEGVEIDFYN